MAEIMQNSHLPNISAECPKIRAPSKCVLPYNFRGPLNLKNVIFIKRHGGTYFHITTRAAWGVLYSVLSVCDCLSVCQHDNS